MEVKRSDYQFEGCSLTLVVAAFPLGDFLMPSNILEKVIEAYKFQYSVYDDSTGLEVSSKVVPRVYLKRVQSLV